MASWNNPKITNKGLELINSVLNSENITITSIKISSMKYDNSTLINLENIQEIKKSITPSSVIIENNKLKIQAIITNESNTKEYKLETIGIYAKKNNVGDEKLFAVINCENADIIPIDKKTGTVSINFEMFLVINRDVNFSMNYNTSALLTQSALNDTLNSRLSDKADKSTSVKSLRISNNTLYYSTHTNQEFSVTLPETTPDATDGVAGKISNNTVRDLARVVTNNVISEYGIGTNSINNANLNNYLKNGLYVNNNDSSRIRNITTAVINFQYETNWGVQLAMTEEDDPKLYIRAKRNNRWTSFKEMVYKTDIATDTKQGIISKNEIKDMFRKATLDEIWAGVGNG